MIILGLIIAALAATGAVAAVLEGANHHSAVTLSVFGTTLPAMSTAGVFLVGAATACIFLLGCSLSASGWRRGARARRELRDLRDEHNENLQALVAEKADLERQLARERRFSGRAQTIQGRPVPGEGTAGQSFPGETTGPYAAGPGGPGPSGPAYPESEARRRTLTAQIYPHLDR